MLARKLLPPIAILLLMIMINLAAEFSAVPSVDEITEQMGRLIVSFGILAIFAFALIEHLVVVNVYFPGAVTLLLGMKSATEDDDLIIPVFVAIVCGQFCGYSLSYLAGRRAGAAAGAGAGAAEGPPRSLKLFALLTYAHPHAGAISSYIAGVRGLPAAKFLGNLAIALGVWSPFWAIVVFFGLVAVVERSGWDLIFYCYLAVWIGVICVEHVRRRAASPRKPA
jgi:membrane protein DedA with SNARE-associated domain